MNNKKKPAACTQPPWKAYLPNGKKGEILIKIRQETEQAYGQNYDSCPKRMVCIGKSCLGRPLPTKSKTFQKYFSEMKKNLNIVGEQLILENCDICKLRSDCTKPCQQINDYLNRGSKEKIDLVYKETVHNIAQEPQNREFNYGELNFKELPWDCVPELNKKVYDKLVLQRKGLQQVTDECGINNKSYTKKIYAQTLNKLAEYSIMREFLSKKPKLTSKQLEILEKVYLQNKSLTKVSKEFNVSRQSVQEVVKRVKTKYNINIPKFYREIKGKPVYNIPEFLR